MPSYLEIVDTAVKIGLGALISGGAAYFLARINHRADRDKILLERKFDNLERAASDFNDYAHAFSYLLSAIDGVRISQKNDEPLDLSLPQNQLKYEFIRNKDLAFCEKRDRLGNVYSKLRLHGANDAANLISQLPQLETKIRNPVMFDKNLPTKQEIKHAMQAVTRIRTEFYDALHSHYKV